MSYIATVQQNSLSGMFSTATLTFRKQFSATMMNAISSGL